MPERSWKNARGKCADCGHPFTDHYHSIKYSQAGEQLEEEDGCGHDRKTCKCVGYREATDA